MISAPAGRFRPSAYTDALILLASAGILTLSAAMVVIPPDRVAFSFAPDRVVPHLCWSQSLAQFTCPGCGLTRSIISLTHGSLDESLRYHRLGWLLWVLFAAQIPWRLARLNGWRSPRWLGRVEGLMLAILAMGMLVNWIAGKAGGWGN